LDEPTELPEGTEIELVAVDDDHDAEEGARLRAAIDDGVADFERGDHVDGFELIAQMRAKREAASR
jgi:predicted transcriptional regulator